MSGIPQSIKFREILASFSSKTEAVTFISAEANDLNKVIEPTKRNAAGPD